MALTLDDIQHLFDTHGSMAYSGEPVTQLQHALQSATLAEQAGASRELIVAALLHDLGHLLNQQGETPTERGIDDLHQYYALPFLRPLFPDAVLEPIRLHVDAKRCLCAIDASYHARLSADSVRSLQLQGGVFDDEAAHAFLARPYAQDALALRRWDDEAKDASRVTPGLPHFMEMVAGVARIAD
ncbi:MULTISPECIES: phosphonate degradation HD-domain oxygenase [unclassified Caballeronia]|uniref:phosphonate degradation HD-domain oxygenase n=1 Tax=unclassified Caballeronia TaxID=2646786 RepID=UPI00285DDC28|nr:MULTISPECIES: phosphonate degradation HD-domain oxygenase [unclassified Caballeronia]MDR5817426.1 HD domain-containing protein [Caballeronia sp. LZ033]MDR5882263.1 HD domain-containing protein [Caballeronia sp. LZ032]